MMNKMVISVDYVAIDKATGAAAIGTKTFRPLPDVLLAYQQFAAWIADQVKTGRMITITNYTSY